MVKNPQSRLDDMLSGTCSSSPTSRPKTERLSPGFEVGSTDQPNSTQSVAALADVNVGHLCIQEVDPMLLALLQKVPAQLPPAHACISSAHLPVPNILLCCF